MALGERFRSGGARGIARFLSDHQDCAGGFDVHRDEAAGTGRLKVTCAGCGESITYKAAEAEHLVPGPTADANGSYAPEQKRDGARIKPVPPKLPASDRGGDDSFRLRTGGGAPEGGRWLPIALIAALIGVGAALIAVGLTRGDDEGGDASAGQPATAPVSTPTEPASEPPPDSPPAVTGNERKKERPRRTRLDRRDFEDGLFAVGVPAGWGSGAEGDATVLDAPGEVARITIFFELGTRPPGQLAQDAGRFLVDRHPGGELSRSRAVRLGGEGGATVAVDYGSGTETALVLADRGYSFLILTRVNRGASERVANQAEASSRSFRAKG
jgi:hypothetical protein